MNQANVPLVKSAMRSIDILEYVGAAAQPPGFAQLSSELGIPNSSLFYLLNTLTQRGYLHQESSKGGYLLGPALAMLAGSEAGGIDWADQVQPLVNRVWERTQETVSFSERRGDEMECRISKLAPHSLLSVQRVGERTPLYASSSGKVALATLLEVELDEYLDRTELKRFTPHTLATGKTIRADIQEVRAAGYAISREELALGVIGMSMGLHTNSGLIGTLGVAVPAVRFDEAIMKFIAGELLAAAEIFASRYNGASQAA